MEKDEAETRTRADAVIGHFFIGKVGKSDISLHHNAADFVAVEAKINSPLSARTTHAPNYDQAARYVGCIAELLRRSNRSAKSFRRLSFYVIAPNERILGGDISRKTTKSSIRWKVQQRVEAYEGKKDKWFWDCFLPVLEHIQIESISWEELVDFIQVQDKDSGIGLRSFFENCIKYASS